MTAGGNGPEPPEGSWVFASYADCPSRVAWQRRGGAWVDGHGCRRAWEDLVDPVDTLPQG